MTKRRKSRLPKVPRPAINVAESPLAWLVRRKDKNGEPLLTREQFEAGEQLRRDFTFAALMPRVTADWSQLATRADGGRGGQCAFEFADNVLAARERFNRALDAVGPELAGVLVDVCCFLKGLEMSERTLGWPQRSGKIVLAIALQQLARHYGLISRSSARNAGGFRHWGTEDFRPSADAPADADDGLGSD